MDAEGFVELATALLMTFGGACFVWATIWFVLTEEDNDEDDNACRHPRR
jgi:hypothetical protein